MTSKRKTIIGAIILVVVTAILSSALTLQISTYMSIKAGDNILPRGTYSRLKKYNKVDDVKDTRASYCIEETDEEMLQHLRDNGFSQFPVVIADGVTWCGFRPDRLKLLV